MKSKVFGFFSRFFRLPFLASWCFAVSTKSHRSSWKFLQWTANGVLITRHLPFKSQNIRCWPPMTAFFVSLSNSFVKFERRRCSLYLAIFVFTIHLCASVPMYISNSLVVHIIITSAVSFSPHGHYECYSTTQRSNSDITVHKFIFFLLVKCPSTKII